MTQRRQKFAALLLALCLHACSPNAARSQEALPQTAQPAAVKFDEFGDVAASDIAARLDNFANALRDQPQAKGFVIAYRSQRDLPGLSGRLMNLMRSYLLTTQRLDPDRIAGVDGGEAGCITQELWIVQPGAVPTPRSDAYQIDYEDVESIRKFDEAPLGPDSSYHNSVYDSLEGYANALRKEPRAIAYVIAYAQYFVHDWRDVDERGRKSTRRQVELDPPGTAARELRRIRSELIRKHGIPASRIRLLDGGHRNFAQAELWIVPRGQRAPIATPNTFPKRRG
jgi:hypothetical protein